MITILFFFKGIKLGDYLLSEEIGRGTFGIIRLAKANQSDFFAIKRLSFGGNKFKVKNTLREICSLPVHDNVLHIHEAFIHNQKQVAYLVMDMYKPYTLNDIMEEVTFKMAAKLTCIQDTMQGLHFLHQHQIVHGDIRPFNVMIAVRPPSICCKLTDYGLYSIENTGVENIERDALQTYYQAPEVQRGGRCTKVGDVFSLSQLFFVIITERKKKTESGRFILTPGIKTQEGAFTLSALAHQDILGAMLEDELTGFEVVSPLMENMLRYDPAERPDMETVRAKLVFIAATYFKDEEIN